MRRIVSTAVALFLILPVMLITASCTANLHKTEVVSESEPEVQKEPETGQDERPTDGIPEETVASEPAEPEFVTENVHFSFDSSELSHQAKQTLNSMADYLSKNPNITITIEGHCDERGTDAYNIALGERRAESAKIFLVDRGIGAERMKTVSYGEKRPVAVGHDEDSWSINRRDEFVIN